MAFIGSMSGSNGTSTNAISGSLIVANEPNGSFPTLRGNVKYLISGSKNGSATDDAEFLFDVDVFHSGAVGSNQYMQFKPVNSLRIPSNTTASYIYTSGSTNDLYFTQYAGQYTNTTRLRWLEGLLSTGHLNGGILSTTVGSSTFSVTSGSGLIVSYNATTSSDPYPTISLVKWPTYTGQTLTYISQSQNTRIAIDSTGAIFQKASPFEDGEFQNYIILGQVLHVSGAVTNGAITSPVTSYGRTQWSADFERCFGPLKISGHVLASSGSTLGLTKSTGMSYVEGRNYQIDPNSPNTILTSSDPGVFVSKIYRQYVSGTSVIQDSGPGGIGYTTIDPTQINTNGTLTAISAASKWSIQRVYWFPNSVTRAFIVYYGNSEYASVDEADAAILTESFTEGSNTLDSSILVGYVIVRKDCASLNDSTKARIKQAGVFRSAGLGAPSGGGSSASPSGPANSVQYNNGSAFTGSANFAYNDATNTLTIGTLAIPSGFASFNIASGTGTDVRIGSSAGRTTVYNDLAVGTGNIIGAPGTGANVMNLISSGNVVVKIDTDNQVDNNKFIVQDYRNIDLFSVNEIGNAEVSGNFVVSGSFIQTVTTTTFNLLTTALTGTLNIAAAAQSVQIGGITTTSSFAGDTAIAGRTNLATVVERLTTSNGGTGVVSFDVGTAGIFYVNGPAGDITANFVNVPTTNNRVITPTVILSQSAVARTIAVVQIEGTASSVAWANSVPPTGIANKQDAYGFSLMRSGSAWKVFGQMSSYG